MATIKQMDNQLTQPVTSGQVGQVAGPTQRKAPQAAASGQFTNIGKYLQANQGVGQNLATKTTSGIERNVQDATSRVSDLGTVVGGALQSEEDRVGQASTIAENIKSAMAPGGQLNVDVDATRKIVDGATDLDAIRAQKQNLANQASTSINQAGQQVGLLGDEAGRFQLLRKAIGGTGYTRGLQTLDNTLMSTQGANVIGAAQQVLDPTLKRAGADLSTTTSTLADRASDLAKQAGIAQTQVKDAITGAQGEFSSALQKRLKDAQSQINRENEWIEMALQGKRPQGAQSGFGITALTPEQQAYEDFLTRTFGEQGTNTVLYGVNPLDYIRKGTSVGGAWDLATADEASKFNMLNKLLTGTADTKQAGGKTISDFGPQVDTERFLRDVATSGKLAQEAITRAGNTNNLKDGKTTLTALDIFGETSYEPQWDSTRSYRLPYSEADRLATEQRAAERNAKANDMLSQLTMENVMAGKVAPLTNPGGRMFGDAIADVQFTNAYNRQLAAMQKEVEKLKQQYGFNRTLGTVRGG